MGDVAMMCGEVENTRPGGGTSCNNKFMKNVQGQYRLYKPGNHAVKRPQCQGRQKMSELRMVCLHCEVNNNVPNVFRQYEVYLPGYPEHMLFGEFRRRFEVLAPAGDRPNEPVLDERKAAEDLLSHLDLEKTSYRMGLSQKKINNDCHEFLPCPHTVRKHTSRCVHTKHANWSPTDASPITNKQKQVKKSRKEASCRGNVGLRDTVKQQMWEHLLSMEISCPGIFISSTTFPPLSLWNDPVKSAEFFITLKAIISLMFDVVLLLYLHAQNRREHSESSLKAAAAKEAVWNTSQGYGKLLPNSPRLDKNVAVQNQCEAAEAMAGTKEE
ncbi:Unconventional myosin-XVIIIa [Branchiostoma belcheri]|nr:Unconventional myosin-XVIIIa [Branchiostoma belcheri]